MAALYAERWEIETTFKELKTQQIGSGTILTSKTPDGILQQIWGHLLVHYALRVHMVEATRANADALDPDRLSFTTCLRAARRIALMPPADFPPHQHRPLRLMLDELLANINPPRRPRTSPRAIKRIICRYRVKKPGETDTIAESQPHTIRMSLLT